MDGPDQALQHKIRTIIKKPVSERSSLKVIVTAFSLILFFYIANTLYEKQVEQRKIRDTNSQLEAQVLETQNQEENRGFPVHLIIPAINVDTNIQQVGVASSGEMDVPSSTLEAGWFKFGSHPGEKGNAVIAGHFNGENGEAGVFANLYKLKEGDKIYIEDDKGSLIAFRVRESRTYDPGHADEVFEESDNSHLNLITCDGVWDESKKSYSKRLVVSADITD